jgi:hypothetical protein
MTDGVKSSPSQSGWGTYHGPLEVIRVPHKRGNPTLRIRSNQVFGCRTNQASGIDAWFAPNMDVGHARRIS